MISVPGNILNLVYALNQITFRTLLGSRSYSITTEHKGTSDDTSYPGHSSKAWIPIQSVS